jgi:hypothetical protein
MKHFQNIAIGLLGLTNPEMFIPRPKPDAPSGAPRGPRKPREGQVARALRGLKFLLSALAIGSRTVALADNTGLRNDLRDRARLLYRGEES